MCDYNDDWDPKETVAVSPSSYHQNERSRDGGRRNYHDEGEDGGRRGGSSYRGRGRGSGRGMRVNNGDEGDEDRRGGGGYGRDRGSGFGRDEGRRSGFGRDEESSGGGYGRDGERRGGYGREDDRRGDGVYGRNEESQGGGWDNDDEAGGRSGGGRGRSFGAPRGRRGGGEGGFEDRRREGGGFEDRRREGGGFEDKRREGGGGGGEDGGGEGDNKPRERYIPPDPTEDEKEMFGTGISSGINFDKYDNINVKATGENVPRPVSSFEECSLRKLLLDNISKSGYKKPTPVQKHALPIILNGRDLMACAQTGSGKTAAFLIPMINSLLSNPSDLVTGSWVEPQVIIVSPTRELSLQIFNEARKFAHSSYLKICIVYGGTDTFHQTRNLMKGCHVLVATPGRLNDFVNRGKIKFSAVQYFVLDEADRMLDMGFLPSIEQMLSHETMISVGERRTLMFSATFPEDIQRLAAQYLNDYVFLAVGIVGGACTDVEQVFYEVRKFEKKEKLIEILNSSRTSNELTLVFVEKKRTADFIAAFLCENEFPTTSIHGDRLQSQREQALADFKSGRMPTLVATAVAARGLDIKNVAHVVNYDMPSSIEEYVHRIGRTGRVGNRGRATSFFDPDEDASLSSHLVRILKQAGQSIPVFLNEDAVGGGFRQSSFGGSDVRKMTDRSRSVAPSGPIEVEEEW